MRIISNRKQVDQYLVEKYRENQQKRPSKVDSMQKYRSNIAVIDLTQCSDDRLLNYEQFSQVIPGSTIITSCSQELVERTNRKWPITLVADTINGETMTSLMESISNKYGWHHFMLMTSPYWDALDSFYNTLNATLVGRYLLHPTKKLGPDVFDKKIPDSTMTEEQLEQMDENYKRILTIKKQFVCTEHLERIKICQYDDWFRSVTVENKHATVFLMMEQSKDLPRFVKKLNSSLGNSSDKQLQDALVKKAYFITPLSGFLHHGTVELLRQLAPFGIKVVLFEQQLTHLPLAIDKNNGNNKTETWKYQDVLLPFAGKVQDLFESMAKTEDNSNLSFCGASFKSGRYYNGTCVRSLSALSIFSLEKQPLQQVPRLATTFGVDSRSNLTHFFQFGQLDLKSMMGKNEKNSKILLKFFDIPFQSSNVEVIGPAMNTSWLDSSANHPEEIVCHLHLLEKREKTLQLVFIDSPICLKYVASQALNLGNLIGELVAVIVFIAALVGAGIFQRHRIQSKVKHKMMIRDIVGEFNEIVMLKQLEDVDDGEKPKEHGNAVESEQVVKAQASVESSSRFVSPITVSGQKSREPTLNSPGNFRKNQPNQQHQSQVEAARKKTISKTFQRITLDATYAGQLVHAKYRGEDAFVTLLTKSTCQMTKEVIQEVLEVRNLHHVNVNSFFSVTTESYHICFVQDYCSKGTLAKVLARKKIQLDRNFKLSFAKDIAAGIQYLHSSPIISHGRLTSSNILLDSRWVCKIANIPLPQFEKSKAFTGITMGSASRSKQGNSANSQPYSLVDRFWMAPELLRFGDPPARGTQRGDVYSFGIILYEIMTRQKPYASYEMSTVAIYRNLVNSTYPAMRPNMDLVDDELQDLAQVARLCWDEVPAFRPDFAAIVNLIRRGDGGREVNLIDQMMEMMESYATNLESEVMLRTAQLDSERRRCEDLLSKMLPRSVVEALKNGQIVHPETFESVTVYFSDVVGFTKLATDSSPLEIIDFLNDLYSEFDNIIDLFDCYKVETIGDAYMVASGLPIRNGIRHVAEIANLSLEILSCVATFKIRHRPDRQLQLRIGMHSGPCVAGIIGLKMPRYCLFGDTVNYASRMESSGLALRIHVSPESKELLEAIGGYQLEKRGFVGMKGKGQIETYWLTGREGFDKTLPYLSLAASIEEHEFK